MTEKTEAPTPRRQRRARREGDSGASSYLSQAVAFAVALSCAPAMLRSTAAKVTGQLEYAMSPAERLDASVIRVASATLLSVVWIVIPVLFAAAVAAAAAQAIQTGGVVTASRIAPRLSRLNPVTGLQNLIRGPHLFAVARSIVAGAAVAWLAYGVITSRMVDFARTAGRPHWVLAAVSDASLALGWRIAFLGLLLGALDVTVSRSAWLRRLRMTKAEVIREHRESEGDPHLKAARARAYAELVAQATLGNVRKATVVVVNPTHIACALRYDQSEGDEAPIVVASGDGDFAERIVRAAREAAVPIVRDVPLARALVELEAGSAIPEELYEAVAEILRELWESDR